jgi:site-specific DNA recombinase
MSRSPAKTAKIRCAIYTRKSSEEGLDQAFNSLHAQREACEAYVLSQAGEGWAALPTIYDDGGFSGGNLERPALRRLLADIGDGLIDIVVVYKIDRLTRSLTDFAKIVDRLDGAGASFVSVTQAFNTTTSMGRLTLNVLLSFAQFEREVTGERIRDKIAASKAKGMWMGGNLPLGYDRPTDPLTRALVVNDAEAEIVRLIFDRYLELKSVNQLELWLHRQEIRSKAWLSTRGRQMGGLRFSRGALLHLLKNRVYLGDIVHRGSVRADAHPTIVEARIFAAVQDLLKAQARGRVERPTKVGAALLTGRLFDGESRPMSPVFSYGRGGRTYRYYVSAPLQKGASAADDDTLRRIPGEEADDVILETLERLTRAKGRAAMEPLLRIQVQATCVAVTLQASPTEAQALRRRLVKGERLTPSGDVGQAEIMLPVRLKTRGGRTWLERPEGERASRKAKVDQTLVKGLVSAHALVMEMGAGPSANAERRRHSRGPGGPYKRMLAPLALLAPDIQAAIVAGRQPAGLKLEQLLRADIPLAWADQKAALGF